ncbi:MAG: hypothetical protein LBI03_01380, partial [Clostridiales bacterium]|nr:hypothetical protein [Clostridiales bacterium]
MNIFIKKQIEDIRRIFPENKPEDFSYIQAQKIIFPFLNEIEKMYEETKLINTPYPRQIYSAKREQIVLSVDNWLDVPNEKYPAPPLQMHNAVSRYVVTIIDKSGAKIITPKANIPAGDIAGIVSIAKAVMVERVRCAGNSDEAETKTNVSPAYTQVIPFGRFKNKTPAMILLDNPEDKSDLIKTRGFFQENVGKYKKKKKNIDAIDDAISLLEDGKLNQENAIQIKSGVQTIYDVNHKYMRDTNSQGHVLFYEMKMECYYANKYPWVITIENFFAPGQQTAKGGLTPKIDEKSGYAKGIIRLSDIEWNQLITRMETNLQNFETMWYGRM